MGTPDTQNVASHTSPTALGFTQNQPRATAPLPPLESMRAYRACLHCRSRKTKCTLDANGGRPVSLCLFPWCYFRFSISGRVEDFMRRLQLPPCQSPGVSRTSQKKLLWRPVLWFEHRKSSKKLYMCFIFQPFVPPT